MSMTPSDDSDPCMDAVPDAFRALRADDAVYRLRPGSPARLQRIRTVLQPLAAYHGVTVEDLAAALARQMERVSGTNDDAEPAAATPG